MGCCWVVREIDGLGSDACTCSRRASRSAMRASLSASFARLFAGTFAEADADCVRWSVELMTVMIRTVRGSYRQAETRGASTTYMTLLFWCLPAVLRECRADSCGLCGFVVTHCTPAAWQFRHEGSCSSHRILRERQWLHALDKRTRLFGGTAAMDAWMGCKRIHSVAKRSELL